jgi:hypothetical protein
LTSDELIGDYLTWRDVTLPKKAPVDLSRCKLAYDGHTSILVTDNKQGVHVWSVSGQYDRRLVSHWRLTSSVHLVAVDTQRHVMYSCH